MSETPAEPVLLFDAECGLCRRFVRGLLRGDGPGRLRFAPLQGPWARAYLSEHGLSAEASDTLVFIPDRRQRDRSPLLRTDGALAAAAATGGWWRLLGWLRVVPARWRDPVYRLVARGRHRLPGAGPRPELGRPEWKDRWIDGPDGQ